MLDDNLTGHNKYCPKCDSHLTSLYLCPECGVRYDEWYKADQSIEELADRHAQLMETAKKFEDGFKRRGKLLEKCRRVLKFLVRDQGMNRMMYSERALTTTDFMIMMLDEELDCQEGDE